MLVELEAVPSSARQPRSAEDDLLGKEARQITGRATRIILEAMSSLSTEERMIIRFRFGQSMSVADIRKEIVLLCPVDTVGPVCSNSTYP